MLIEYEKHCILTISEAKETSGFVRDALNKMKPDESAGSFDGFLSRFSAASLKRGEEKGDSKRRENDQLAAVLALFRVS